jgi:hypothetical protein
MVHHSCRAFGKWDLHLVPTEAGRAPSASPLSTLSGLHSLSTDILVTPDPVQDPM